MVETLFIIANLRNIPAMVSLKIIWFNTSFNLNDLRIDQSFKPSFQITLTVDNDSKTTKLDAPLEVTTDYYFGGIPKELGTKRFESFSQVDTTIFFEFKQLRNCFVLRDYEFQSALLKNNALELVKIQFNRYLRIRSGKSTSMLFQSIT